jgi:3-phytase
MTIFSLAAGCSKNMESRRIAEDRGSAGKVFWHVAHKSCWFSLLSILLCAGCAAPPGRQSAPPALTTQAVPDDADDPAIWVNRADPASSLILGTNKVAAPDGALFVFGLDGIIRQRIGALDRPNNVDVEYGFRLSGRQVDIAVLTERRKQRLRVFRIPDTGTPLVDIGAGGGVPVFEGLKGDLGAPMGIALYKRPSDGAVFAVVSRKNGPSGSYLWQYILEDDGAGAVRGRKVREFGAYSGGADNEIEAVAVDDELGFIYYADENFGIRKYHADSDHGDAKRELVTFAKSGFKAQREGIAIYAAPDGTGYILCADQLPAASEYHVYSRQGVPGNPHLHQELGTFRGAADSTDGIEVSSSNLGARFPRGLFAAMNSRGRNFLVYRWEDVAGAVRLH